jgi:hypothetical protein
MNMYDERQALDGIHEVLQDNRLKAVGKIETISEILYGASGEYLDLFEDFPEDLEPYEEEESEEDEEN